MKWSEITESAVIKFYHVTTSNRLNSIKEHGLVPGKKRRWKNQFGGTLGDQRYVYLISDFTEAVRFAARWEYQNSVSKSSLKPVILVIEHIPVDQLIPDDCIEGQVAGHSCNPPQSTAWFKLKASILPKDITRVIPLTLELKRQAVVGSTAQEP